MKEHKCQYCGAAISESAARRTKRCRKCAIEQRSAEVRKKWEALDRDKPLYCAWCGKRMHITYRRLYQGVNTCSSQCASYYFHSLKKESPEALKTRIIAFIKQRGVYTPLSEIRKGLHLSDKLVYTRGLSIPELNWEAGVCDHRVTNTLTADEVKERYKTLLKNNPSIRRVEAAKLMDVSVGYLDKLGIKASEIRKSIGVLSSVSKTKQEIHDRIVTWLAAQPGYQCAKDICEALHIDYYCSIQKQGFNVEALNKEAGHDKPTISHYEALAKRYMTEVFPDAKPQKTFVDCLSDRGYKLRFDLYVPSRCAIVEVNGDQHYNKKNKYYSERNNQNYARKKKQYALEHGYTFFEIPCSPSYKFIDTLFGVIEQIKGLPLVTEEVRMPSNCWETQTGQSAAKLQTSEEGSTTIPKGSTPKQVETEADL